MAAKFTISDESEEREEGDNNQSSSGREQQTTQGHGLTLPELRMTDGVTEPASASPSSTTWSRWMIQNTGPGRIRLNSESHASTVSRDEEDEAGTPTEAPFRGRSKSAPPALWAAQKYGRQLRRMSDEFDSLLDKGEMKRVKSAGSARQMHHSKSWWSYLFSHQEIEGENSHHENHTHRTE